LSKEAGKSASLDLADFIEKIKNKLGGRFEESLNVSCYIYEEGSLSATKPKRRSTFGVRRSI